MRVRPAEPADRATIERIHRDSWGGNLAIAHGTAYHLDELPTLVAVEEEVVGVLTFQVDGDGLEVVSIDADPPGRGTGTALLAAAAAEAEARGLARMWLITTNDNLDALRFYQRRGMRITAVSPDAVARSRLLKPRIPAIGAYGIPIRDEIVLTLWLDVGSREDPA